MIENRRSNPLASIVIKKNEIGSRHWNYSVQINLRIKATTFIVGKLSGFWRSSNDKKTWSLDLINRNWSPTLCGKLHSSSTKMNNQIERQNLFIWWHFHLYIYYSSFQDKWLSIFHTTVESCYIIFCLVDFFLRSELFSW